MLACMHAHVTHLHASFLRQAALHLGTPIVNTTWLHECANEGRFVDYRAHLRKPLEGCEICVTGLDAGEIFYLQELPFELIST